MAPVVKDSGQSNIDFNSSEFVDSQNLGNKISILRRMIEQDPKAIDLKWSFFVAACNTYRYDTCLRPFPPMYIRDDCKDIDALRKVIEKTPPLIVLCRRLCQPDASQNYADVVELLYWAVARLRDPYIASVNKIDYDSIVRKAPSEMPVTPPNLIFQVENTKHAVSNERWKSTAQSLSTFYAYHGSRLENFHSIINYGLQQNMCKVAVYGEGIYFSSEFGVSLPHSPTGYGWGGSSLGAEIACVALCELINHSDVKRGDFDKSLPNARPSSIGNRVPTKYYLVTNNELVKIRYLFVYCNEPQIRRIDDSGMISWLKQHKLLTLVLGYVVLLASVGFTHNKQMMKYYKFFVQKTGLDENFQ